MDLFNDYLSSLDSDEQRARLNEVLAFVGRNYPQLKPRFAWNQPMFTDHETFIVAFSVAKKHIAVAPEKAALDHFKTELDKRGIAYGKMLLKMPFDRPFDYDLLAQLIDYNIADKKDVTTFWRKPEA